MHTQRNTSAVNILSHQNSMAQKSVGAEDALFALVEVLQEAWRKDPETDRLTVLHPLQSRNWWVQFGAGRVVRANTWPARQGQQRTKGQVWR